MPTARELILGGTERRLWTSWWAPRPSKSTGVLPANFSFEREVLLGLSANWFRRVSDVEACLWALRVLWAFLPLVLTCFWCWGPLWGRVALWAFCPLVLTCVYPWFVTVRCYLGVFESRFWHVCLEDALCWGSVYLGLHVGHCLGGFMTVLPSGACLCIPCVWLVFSLPFVNREIQVQFIKKSLPTQLWLRKRKI